MGSKSSVVRTHDDESRFIQQRDAFSCSVVVGMVPNTRAPGRLLRERDAQSNRGAGILPEAKQIANIATLPGVVKVSIALLDMQSRYGFTIGTSSHSCCCCCQVNHILSLSSH